MDQSRFDVVAGTALLTGTNLLLVLFGPGVLSDPARLGGYLAPTAAGFLFLAAGFDAGPTRPHVLRGTGMIALGTGFIAAAAAAGPSAGPTFLGLSALGTFAAVAVGLAVALGYGTVDADIADSDSEEYRYGPP